MMILLLSLLDLVFVVCTSLCRQNMDTVSLCNFERIEYDTANAYEKYQDTTLAFDDTNQEDQFY